ncbi:hypothetical protein RBB75_01675 [Tunturibacter empetritectus]|uniref:Uncharacterized protein n=1 Tax=Tunturiibacter empetritectus TaxID=3069691 RepID=A0AAU7ZEM0_9BACT
MASLRRGSGVDVVKESVWDYPRPPRLERTERHLRVVHEGVMVAETRRGMRILETSHPFSFNPFAPWPFEDDNNVASAGPAFVQLVQWARSNWD